MLRLGAPPVPVMSREPDSTHAITNASCSSTAVGAALTVLSISSPFCCGENLDPVAVAQMRAIPLAARHDLVVERHRDPTPVRHRRVDERPDRAAGIDR